MTDRRLSIIIPVYNVEAYVGKTLESVFRTTARDEDFEVIVVNDGTRDGSMEVVRHYSDRPNITIIEQENQGLSVARTNGWASAKGEYVWFIDSDDWIAEDGVGTVLKLLEERPEAEVLMFPLFWVYEDAEKNHLDYQVDGEMVVNGKEVIRDLHFPVWASQRFVFRRTLMEKEWLYFPKGLIHQDEYFGPVLMFEVNRVHVQGDLIYYYLVHPGATSTTLSTRSSDCYVSVYRQLMKYMNETMSIEDKKWFRPYCSRLLRLAYTRVPYLFGTQEFNVFARNNGLFVWREWKKANPQVSFKTKLGRLFYYRFLGIWLKWKGIFNS